MMKRGFTLVELSIVLVIIGLLIGGILAAQSMIKTARVNSFVRQIQQYDVAVANFQTKYNSLPGDSVVMGCIANANNICGDGSIEEYSNSLYGNFNFSAEIADFWPQLQKGGFTYGANQTFTATVPAGGINADVNNPNLPDVKASITGQIMAGYCAMSPYINCWEIADWKNTSGPTSYGGVGPIFTTEMSLAVDTKMDDGKADSGAVRNWYRQVQILYSGLFVDNCASASSNYQINNKGNICLLSIGLLSQVGQSQ